MIGKDELTRIARRKGYPPHIIEKDYALTWALKAMYSNPKLAKFLVFKGGTCISKVYAESYRLSEDLDFSAGKTGKLTSEELKAELKTAFDSANVSGAPSLEMLEDECSENPWMAGFKVRYRGPLGQPGRIKMDLSLKEHVIYATEERTLREKSYSDAKEFEINCYSMTELVAEKVRAIMQRGKTRDYYDVWQIYSRKELKTMIPQDDFRIRKIVKEKCTLNDVTYAPELMFDKKRLIEVKKEWEKSLGYLVAGLPDFDEVMKELKELFWEENELAQFNEDLKVEHVRNLARQPRTEPLVTRSLELMAIMLDATKIGDVLRALEAITQLYAVFPDLRPEIDEHMLEKVIKLTKDRDLEVKDIALSLFQTMSKKRGNSQL